MPPFGNTLLRTEPEQIKWAFDAGIDIEAKRALRSEMRLAGQAVKA